MNDATPEALMRSLGGQTTRWPAQFGKIKVLSMDHVMDTAPRNYILKGLMSPGEMSVWWGPPKCGKSFLMLHIAYAIPQGRSVLGRRVKARPVLYVAAEGEAGLAARLRALQYRYGNAQQFYLIAQPIDMLRPGGDLAGVKQAALHVQAGLIVFDTLNRVIAGGDENSSEDMGRFITNVGTLRCDTGAHVAVVHHGTKSSTGSTPRGHSSLIGAADLVVEIAKAEDGDRRATITAAKDDPDGRSMGFALGLVELGTDQDGDPITTCLVDEKDTTPEVGQRLTNTERKAQQFLADLIVAEGRPLPIGSGFPIRLHGVPEVRWRDECDTRRLSTAGQRDSRTTAFRRAFSGLLSKGAVAARDDLVWLTAP